MDSSGDEKAIGEGGGEFLLKNDSIFDFSFVLIFEKRKGPKMGRVFCLKFFLLLRRSERNWNN